MKNKKISIQAFLTGIPISTLGGLIGLGGAEFRLPVLVGLFKYGPRKAVALNIAISLITVTSSLIFRIPSFNVIAISSLLLIIISMIAGSMTGAFIGAEFSKKISDGILNKFILILLVSIGVLLMVESFVPFVQGGLPYPNAIAISIVAILFGIGIGFVSSMLGVAGGELIIPTLILLFGVDAKLAGTASLLISLPTMLIGISRHAANKVYDDRKDFTSLVFPMGIGSILGAFIGSMLIAYVSSSLLKLILGVILIFSAIKLFLERKKDDAKKEKNNQM